MSRATGEFISRTIEKGQWSGLDSHRVNLLLNGMGEGYVEEVYFGRGFSSPPTFSHSATFNQEEEEVLTWMMTSARGTIGVGVDQYGTSSDSFSHNGMIHDPSFESQGKFWGLDADASAIIPSVSEQTDKLYAWWGGGPDEDVYTPLLKMIRGSAWNEDWAERYNSQDDWWWLGPHKWVQTDDVRERWSVVIGDSHDLGVGEAGQASARAVIGPNGFTNWLIPIMGDQEDYYGPVYWPTKPGPEQWRIWRSVMEHPNDTTGIYGGYSGGTVGMTTPPYLNGFRGFAYVRSPEPVELQVKATLSCEDYYDEYFEDEVLPLTRGTKVFPATDYHDSGADEGDYWYRELAEVEYRGSAGGGGWSRVDIDLPYSGWSPWPNASFCLAKSGDPWDVYWTFRYRIKGTPGTVVDIDNIYLDRRLRNAQIPVLTVGVDEWIRDEAGVYIGARLWIKLDTPSQGCFRVFEPFVGDGEG